MKTENNIQDKIKATFKAIDTIEVVNAPPFFKDKTMQRLFAEKEEPIAWSWFSPKLQFATLVCVVVLNVFAFMEFESDDYESNLSAFSESYGLSTSTETSLLN